MEITWFGHSCFRIKGKEAVVLIDPCPDTTGYSLGKVQANIVAISHAHPGHSYLDTLQEGYRAIKGPGEYEIKDTYITGIATFHDDAGGKKSGKNTVYVIEMEGVTLCHLGDLGHALTPEVMGELGSINVLFVPVGGHSTIWAQAAADLVRNVNPGIAIPMHYKTEAEKADLEFPERFLKELGIKDLASQAKFVVTRTNIPASTQVVLLDYPH
ncbi:MAG: MBL fold metallo-hydrolase [Dehalococcoidia bacterium]|jgi:L-ascorbate metabolism protein UlaG (beta-lactamase superfamily)